MFSLEKLCVNFIIEKFERFYNASIASDDTNLHRNLEYLQRRFSGVLMRGLHEAEKLDEDHLNFLLTKHLSFLDGFWLKNILIINSIDAIFHRLPNLTRICFRRCADDGILECIAKHCPKIVEIDVSYSKVTDYGVRHLCEAEVDNGILPCPELKILFIKNSCVTNVGAEFLLRRLPSLERFDYPDVPLLLYIIHQENLLETTKVYSYNLVDLNLYRCKYYPHYTDILKTCFAVCPKLNLIQCHISNEEQLTSFTNSNLKEILLWVLKKTPKMNVDNFFKMSGCNLTIVQISHCSISVSSLAVHCPVLKELKVHDVEFTGDNASQNVFHCLTKCFVSEFLSPSSFNSFCLLLSSSPRLESLSFLYCILSPEVKKEILIWCKSSQLKNIDFTHVELEMNFLKEILLNSSSLKEMFLDRCDFDVHDTKGILCSVGLSLPNKPNVSSTNFINKIDLHEPFDL